MSGSTVKYICGTLMLLIISLSHAFSQDAGHQGIRIMFYNVENLFDTRDDTLTDDNEFLPDSPRRWNSSRYRKKISSLSKVIISAGEWSPPSIVAMCEVENRRVLEDLIYTTPLSRFNYGIIHEDSRDPRGIDVCLIYNKDEVSISDFSYLDLAATDGGVFLTRSVLYTLFVFSDDTISLFVNHWPSRRGGVMAAESRRFEIAEMVKQKTDSLLIKDRDHSVIVMGDFNATPEDEVIKVFEDESDAVSSLFNLSGSSGNSFGTYRYQGKWEVIDQVLVSEGLTEPGKGRSVVDGTVRILDHDFLFIPDPNYPGKTPFSTWWGYRYRGGYSDHLPVVFDLRVR